MSLGYKVHVDGIEINGHPISTFATSLAIAAKNFDDFSKQYPFNLVTLTQIVENVIKTNEPREHPLQPCPFNHTDFIGERPALVRGSNGKSYCRVCGWAES